MTKQNKITKAEIKIKIENIYIKIIQNINKNYKGISMRLK